MPPEEPAWGLQPAWQAQNLVAFPALAATAAEMLLLAHPVQSAQYWQMVMPLLSAFEAVVLRSGR